MKRGELVRRVDETINLGFGKVCPCYGRMCGEERVYLLNMIVETRKGCLLSRRCLGGRMCVRGGGCRGASGSGRWFLLPPPQSHLHSLPNDS